MPIAMKCGECGAKLNAPDTVAGKRVKCPKCATLMTVPKPDEGFEVIDDEFDVVDEAPAKKKRPPLEEDDDDRPVKKRRIDDDEEEDDRPRKKKGKKKPPPKNNMPMIIGGAIAALLVIGLGVYFAFFNKSDKKTATAEEKDKDGWVKYSASDNSYSVLVPETPTTADDKFEGELLGIPQSVIETNQQDKAAAKVDEVSVMAKDGSRVYMLGRIKTPQNIPDPNQVTNLMWQAAKAEIGKYGLSQGQQQMDISGGSQQFAKYKLKNGRTMIFTIFAMNNYIYDLAIVDDGDINFNDEKLKKFVNSFSPGGSTAKAEDAGTGRRIRR